MGIWYIATSQKGIQSVRHIPTTSPANVEKPTGSSESHWLEKRAKDTRIKIDATEVIGSMKKNDLDSTSDEMCSDSVSGTHLADKNGTLDSQQPRNKKVQGVNAALCRHAEEEVASAHILAQALGEVTEKLCSTGTDDLKQKWRAYNLS